jgi:hypothetical protein
MLERMEKRIMVLELKMLAAFLFVDLKKRTT